MNKLVTLSLAVILLVSLILVGCGGPPKDTGQTYELKMAIHVSSRASIVPAYYQPWADAVAEATNNRVKITIYPEETLVKEADQYDAVVSDLADIAACAPDATPGRFPLAEVAELPLLFPNQKVGAEVMWDILDTLSADAYKDVVVLGVAIISPAEYFGNKEVKVPSDLNGMRMRSGGKVESWILEATGATPVDIETGDLATSVERSLVDGTFLSWSFGIVTGVKDMTEYRTKLDLFYRAFVIVMNKDKFNSMPKVLQDAIWSVSGQSASANHSAAEEAGGAGAIHGVGGTVYTPTAAELDQWKAAMSPVWDEWVTETGGDAQAVLDKVKELAEKYAKQ